MKVLIGYDGSACAEAALDDLQRAGLPKETEALIITVAEFWLPPPPPSSQEIVAQAMEVKVPADLKRVYAKGSTAVHAAGEMAATARRRLQTNFPTWEVSQETSCGSPAWELILKADQWQPDLIVVGSHGRTALGRFILGSVSQRTLTEARCSVRIARGRVEEPVGPIRVLVGLDGSPGGDVAVGEVASRAWSADTEVKLVVVDDPLVPTFVGSLIPPLAETIEESNRSDREWVERMLAAAAERISRPGLKVTTLVAEGDPKHELARLAEEWGADSIFVGSTGFSNRFERFVLGSVSAAVAARAHCSVEVVRKRREAEPA
jgi:nucleotide-binding universal stress UspA family protein